MQSRLLGEHWVHRGLSFDRVCVGPCLRHKDTARIVADVYVQAGLAFPEPSVQPEFDEYQGEAVLSSSLPGLLEHDPRVRDLHAAFQFASGSAERRATFQKLFAAVIGMWVNGVITPQGVETWPQFCSRVHSGLASFLSGSRRKERVAIFTSGGPIAVAMQRALQLSPANTLQVSWMSRNSSWSEFLYDAQRLTLSSFNAHAHLQDADMLTYR